MKKSKKPTLDNDTLKAARNRYLFEEAERSTGHINYVKNAITCSNYYAGEQWDADTRAKLDAQGRPALTLNMFLSTVNAMIGEQLERKVEITFTASKTGTSETAYALNAITKSILNENNFTEVEEMVFADGIITDRGFYDIRMDFENNLQGDVNILTEDGTDVIIDAEAKDSDPSTWNEIWISRWMTPDEIGVRYGEDKIQAILAHAAHGGASSQASHVQFESSTFGRDSTYTRENDEEVREVRRVRVIERQHYKYTDVVKYADMDTGDLRQVPYGVTLAEAKKFADEEGYGVIETKGRRLKMTASAGDVMLEDDWSMYRTFTLVPFFPYFRRGKPHGIGRHILDPQDLLNKTSSQELHIVNTTANSGWIVQENSLVDMDTDDLETRGAETGLVLTFKRGYDAPAKITPNQIPTGIERISQKAALTIREVSAVNASMLGTARADQSGTAQAQATTRGQMQVSVVLASLKKARRMVAKKILELVQDFYTETRYFKVTEDSVLTSNQEGSDLSINQPDEQDNIMNDVTVGEYGISVGHAPAGGSALEAEFNEVMALRERGVNIPDHIVIKYSNLRERNEVSEYIKNMTGLGEKSEEQQELETAKLEFELGRMEKELQLKDAEIDKKVADASVAMAKADSQEGYNQAEMEIARLQLERDKMRQDASLRVALAARSHVNASSLNDSRMATQLAMKTMDSMEKDKPPTKESK